MLDLFFLIMGLYGLDIVTKWFDTGDRKITTNRIAGVVALVIAIVAFTKIGFPNIF